MSAARFRHALAVLITMTSSPALAVSGIVVNTHDGVDSLQYYGTIDGELWRHDINNDVVTSSAEIYAGPASRPAISPDGLHVAFIKATGAATGKVVLINIDGTGEVELADCLRNSLVDFPHADWVYFTMGGYHETSSGLLKRIHISTRAVEEVQVKGRGSSTVNTRIAQLQISNDLTRAVVRTGDDNDSDPYGEIVALDLDASDLSTSDVHLDQTIGTRYSCAGGLFADGVHAMDGNSGHTGFDIRDYAGSAVKSFLNADAFDWPPSSGAGTLTDSEHAIFNTGGSTNHADWMCIVTGGDRDYKWHDMLLINWVDERCIHVTNGLSGIWDHGDFWEGDPGTGPVDSTPPLLINASTTSGTNDTVHVTFSEALSSAAETEAHFAIDGGVTVSAAAFDGGSDRIVLTTSAMSAGSYTLTVNGVQDLAGNTIATDSQTGFSYTEVTTNQVPVVAAGDDQITYVGALVTLLGSVTDDGLPSGAPTVSWAVTVGDAGQVTFGDAANQVTTVNFAADGVFVLTLTGDDGELSASDDVQVLVQQQQSITLLSPLGGEQWTVGSTQNITWETTNVDDVMILFSPDGGVSWETLMPTIDTSSADWGAWPWTVPDSPTDLAIIKVEAYLQGSAQPPESDVFSIIAAGTDPDPDPNDPVGPGPMVAVNCQSVGAAPWLALALLLVLRRRRH